MSLAQPRITAARCSTSGGSGSTHGSARRALVLGGAAALALTRPARASAAEWKTAPNGIKFKDEVVGTGAAALNGDTILITFTAFTVPEDGSRPKAFDPFILGGSGSSASKGYKLALGGINGDLLEGWNIGIVGGDGIEPMKEGGKRTLVIPASLAYGQEGHHCRRGNLKACEVFPGAAVEITTSYRQLIG
mmetsp:Transcript_4368/g.15148  ORF Transcript_4368/g.15148 Transcript_4368/m.15148 type:complete len:191 (+) Transcript_4368:22-594(+)